MESGNVESHKVAILPCGQVVEQWNGTPVEGTRGPGPLVFMEKRRGDPCVEIWTTGMARMTVDIDRLRQGLDALEAQSPHRP